MTRDTRETITDLVFVIVTLIVFVALCWWIA